MSRNRNLEIATRSLKIIEQGFYDVEEGKVLVANDIDQCVSETITYSPSELDFIANSTIEKKFETLIETKNCTAIQAIEVERTQLNVMILNFASAKNPGGGFLGGASAQEESLARSSCLYKSLTKENTLYKFNKGRKTFLYSDYMIYSPQVVFWNNDSGELYDKPIKVDVITSPAPNKGAMLQHNRIEDLENLEDIFLGRIEKVLSLAYHKGAETIILGAWGCGVFRNDSTDVAMFFKSIINRKFNNAFKKIVFAVYDNSPKTETFLTFKKVLANEN